MPLTIHELNHVAIHVRDLDASIRFYGEILGLPRLERPNFDFGGAWFAFGDGQELHLVEDTELSPDRRWHHHFALRVTDTFAARKALEARGVAAFTSHGPRPDGAMQLFLLDPDGYRIELFSGPPAAAPE